MQRVFKIAVNGTNYDVVVEELTSATSAIMPNYTPAPATVSAAAAAPVAAPKAAAAAPAGAGDQCAQMGGVVSGVMVKEGQQVTRGQKVAEIGSTGADGVKLHFEIRRQGNPVDPLQYLPKR